MINILILLLLQLMKLYKIPKIHTKDNDIIY
jgi:hypothetical protein